MNSISTQTTEQPFFYESLDLSYLHTVSGGDKDFEKDMLQSMLSEMSEKMRALATAIETGDVKNIKLQSHSLKNLAGIIGVPLLTERFKEMEGRCEEVPNAYLRQTFSPCERQWEYSKKMLQALLNE